MKCLVLVAVGLGCGPGLKDASDRSQYRNSKLHDFAAELSHASHAHDVATIRELLRDHVTIGGMWFSDVKCMTRFAAPARVSGQALDELAACIASLDLAPSSRVDSLPDVAVLTYGGGLELEARFLEGADGAWLNWIGYVGRRDAMDALPTVSATALEALRVDGDSQAPLAGPSTFDELAIAKAAYAWLKICIDSNGTVTGAHVREASSPKAARVFGAAAQTWKFRPFILRGQPAPVCAMVRIRYPTNPDDKEVLPLPLPAIAAAANVPPAALTRVSGTKLISPDRADKTRINRVGIWRIHAAVHYCIDENGRVNYSALIRSSGLEGYDRKLLATIRQWTYAPFLDEGKPVAVCSSVHFIYSQDAAPRQPGMMKFGSDPR